LTYHPALPQITYPTPSNTNANQLNAEPPPPPQQAQEPPQQIKHFSTHDTILTIIGGSNIDFKPKGSEGITIGQVNHVTVEGQHEAQPPIECRKFIEAKGEFKKVPLDPRVPDKKVCIDTEANQQDQEELLSFLDKNNNVFAWSTSNLVGVSRDVIEHRL
jgi:hypothetical protein